MATIENFLLRFKVDGQRAIDGAANSIKNLSDEVKQFGANTGPLDSALGGIVGRFGAIGLAAGAALGAFAALGARALQLAGEISDVAGATGIAEGTLMNFRSSVIEAGGSANDFANIATKLNENIQKAAVGNENLQNSFRTLGVFVRDANGEVRSTETILREITDKFRSGQISASQYAASIELLGGNINKLDLTKLSAAADPIKDEQIRKLDEYNSAIDKLTDKINTGLITAFGNLAIALNNIFDEEAAKKYFDRVEAEANKRGQTYRERSEGFLGFLDQLLPQQDKAIPGRLREMTQKEREAFALRQAASNSEAQRIFGSRIEQSRQQLPPTSRGDFGAANPREAERLAESRRQAVLRGEEEAARQREENARLLAQAELEQGQAEIRRYEQTQRLVRQGQIDAEAEREATRAALAAQEDSFARANIAAGEQIARYREATDAAEARLQLERELQGVDAITADSRRRIFDIEQQRKQQLEDIRNISNLTYADRLVREQQINAEVDRAIQLEKDRAAEYKASQDNFIEGWKNAFKQYADNAANAANQSKRVFDTFSRGFEDAIVRFVQTGKLSFKDLANSIIADIVRIQAQKMFMSLFGGGGFFGSLFGFANGGPTEAMKPIIVGERGPELFIPKMAGNVISNQNLTKPSTQTMPTITNVTYNINAVDAPSFRALVARDPQFIYNVSEVGRRGQPNRRLA